MSGSALRAETLAAMRAFTAGARPDTALIKRPPTDRTVEGFDPRSAIATATTTALLIPPGRGTPDAEGRVVAVTAPRLALPADLDIQVRDYVQVGARMFRVVSLSSTSQGWAAQIIAECEEVR